MDEKRLKILEAAMGEFTEKDIRQLVRIKFAKKLVFPKG